nr:MAG TPA: hypothetical protein [Caudoviricetes sp.]
MDIMMLHWQIQENIGICEFIVWLLLHLYLIRTGKR